MRGPTRFLPCIFLLAAVPAAAITPAHIWSKSFGDGTGDQRASAVAVDPSDNVFVTGTFTGSVDFGGGSLTGGDIFLAKLDLAGTHVWSKQFGSAEATSRAVATDSDGNVVIVGDFRGTIDFGGGPMATTGLWFDAFVAKFDANGNHLWSHQISGENVDRGYSVAIDASGNVIVAGSVDGTVDFGGGPLTTLNNDVFVAKYDAAGNYSWAKIFGGIVNQSAYSVTTDRDTNIIVTGSFEASVNFGGSELTATLYDVFIAKFEPNGSHIWSVRYGNTAETYQTAVATDSDSNIIVTGEVTGPINFGGGVLPSVGSMDLFLVEFDGAGAHRWSTRIGGTFAAQLSGAVVADANDVVTMTGLFGENVLLAAYAKDGTPFWNKSYGDAEFQWGRAIAVDSQLKIVVAGEFTGQIDFGGSVLTDNSSNEVFVAKLGGYPTPTLITSFSAVASGRSVEVRWETVSDEGIEGATLFRRESSEQRPIAIATLDPTAARYTDTKVAGGHTYYYELLVHTAAGIDVRSTIASATVPALATSLGQNHPNPFNPVTTIDYTLAERTAAVVEIYDASGALVIALDDGGNELGEHHVQWNGRDASGRAVASGVYFYRLAGMKNVAPWRMVLLK